MILLLARLRLRPACGVASLVPVSYLPALRAGVTLHGRSEMFDPVWKGNNVCDDGHRIRAALIPAQGRDWFNHHRAACRKITGQDRDNEQQRRNEGVRQWVKGGDAKQQ